MDFFVWFQAPILKQLSAGIFHLEDTAKMGIVNLPLAVEIKS